MDSNYHTHTTFCDGADSPEELVLEAIRLGCPEIGFSGHSHLREDVCSMSEEGTLSYCREIRRLQDKYSDNIVIRLGIEHDYFSEIDTDLFEYSIGAVHFVEKDGRKYTIDESPEKFHQIVSECYGGDPYSLAEDYYALVGKLWEKTGCTVIAHFDLITKFNEADCLFDTTHPRYLAASNAALEDLLKSPCILEVNTGAMARGYRKSAYPEPRLLDQWLSSGRELILSSDCHSKKNLLFSFEKYQNLPRRRTLFEA